MGPLGIGDVIDQVRAAREGGVDAVVATVVSASTVGVTPGTRLMIYSDGHRIGSIAEGLDVAIGESALRALDARRSTLVSFHSDDTGWTETRSKDSQADIFLEVLARPPHLIVVGAGHIAVPLAHIASILEFRVTVLDDRPEYATQDRFPTADQVIVGPYAETLGGIPTGRDTFVVLVTRGHVHDRACLELMLRRDTGYIGMIGSKRRVRTVLERLSRDGYDPDRLRLVFAPIGLDIGAQSPGEIALAILAEIVNLRRGGRAPSLALGERLHV